MTTVPSVRGGLLSPENKEPKPYQWKQMSVTYLLTHKCYRCPDCDTPPLNAERVLEKLIRSFAKKIKEVAK